MIAVVQRTAGPKLKPTAFTNVKVYCISDPQGGHPYKRDGEARRKFWKELLRGTNSYITHDLLWVSLTVSCEYHSQPEYTGSVHIFLISTKTVCFTPKRYGEHPPSFWYGCVSPPRMSTCQPVYWRWVLCEVCLHFMTWLLSRVCRWFSRVHLPKLLFSTFDDQNQTQYQRWTVFFCW